MRSPIATKNFSPGAKPGLFRVLGRGVRKRCPHCGQGRLFQGWYRLNASCENCQRNIQKDAIDVLAFMYISTAVLTGTIVILMFLWKPANLWLGRIVIGVVALILILLTLPIRKGIALALDYWSEIHLNEE